MALIPGDDPVATDAEERVVGAVMLSPDALLAVGKLTADDFYSPRHRVVYEAIQALYDRGEPVDPMTLAAQVNKQGMLEAVGGLAGLMGYTVGTLTSTNVGHYAAIVRDRAFTRRLDCATGAASQRLSTGADWRITLTHLRSALEELEDDAHLAPQTLGHAMAAEVSSIAKGDRGLVGLATGIGIERCCPTGVPLDKVTTIFAETGAFKTTLAANIAWNMAAAGNVVLNVSFEDSNELGAQRALGRLTGVSYGLIAARKLAAADELVMALSPEDRAIGDRIIMEDRCEPNIDTVIRLARYYKRTRGCRAVFVDYLQLLDGPGSDKQVLDDAVRKAQRVAKQERIAFVFLSQVKAEVTNRKKEDGGPRPSLDDCLGSSSIRIGSKLGLGVFRPWRYCAVPMPKGEYKEYAELAMRWPGGNFLKDIYPRILEVLVTKNVVGEAPVRVPCLIDLPTGRIEPFNAGF